MNINITPEQAKYVIASLELARDFIEDNEHRPAIIETLSTIYEQL